MKLYIQKLQNFVSENKIVFDQDCPQPCLDTLWWHFGEYHNLDNETTRAWMHAIWTKLEALSFQEADALVADIGCLGAEYERLAFTAGLRLGVQLMLEIQSGCQ